MLVREIPLKNVPERYRHPAKRDVWYFGLRTANPNIESDKQTWHEWVHDNLTDYEFLAAWDLAVYSEEDAVLVKMTWL